MFGRVSQGNNNTTFANFNAKSGLFTIDHKEQNAEKSYREHKTDSGRTVFKEEHEALIEVNVRRILLKKEQDYNDKTKEVTKVWLSVRDQKGDDAVVKFSMGSFALKMLALVNAADLSQPITFRGGAFEAGTKKKDMITGAETVRENPEPFLIASQGGEKLKPVYNEDPAFKIPKVEKIEVKNPQTGAVLQTVSDPTNRDNYILELAGKVITKVDAARGSQPAPAPAPAATGVQPTDDDAGIDPADILGDGGTSDEQQFAPAGA